MVFLMKLWIVRRKVVKRIIVPRKQTQIKMILTVMDWEMSVMRILIMINWFSRRRKSVQLNWQIFFLALLKFVKKKEQKRTVEK